MNIDYLISFTSDFAVAERAYPAFFFFLLQITRLQYLELHCQVGFTVERYRAVIQAR